jgi:hypothetical protein
MPALAARVAKSKRTLQRMERQGRLAKPEHLIRKPGLLGGGSERFYSPEEVERVVTALAAEYQRSEVPTTRLVEHRPVRPWLSYGHAETEPKQARRWSRIEDPTKERAPDPEPLTSEQCPHCGGKDTILWSHSGIRGGHPSLNQFAVCEKCNEVVHPVVEFAPRPQRVMAPDHSFTSVELGLSTRRSRRRGLMLGDVQGAVHAPKPVTPRPPGILPPRG